MKKYFLFVLIALIFNVFDNFAQNKTNVLVFSKTEGWRHKSIETGIIQFKKWAKDNNWKVSFSEETSYLNNSNLEHTNVLVFLNTTGNVLDENSKKAIKKFINEGGGFVGIHSACDTEFTWPWYYQLIGAQFESHPKTQKATMNVHHSCNHPSISHFKETFSIKDEWYNFKEPVLKNMNVLMTLDESSYEGKKMNKNHPIAWYHYYEGGRVFYTGMGHTKEIFHNTDYEKHIIKAVEWAAGNSNIELEKGWTNLLDKNLSKWDKFMGVPHNSVDLEGVEKSKDGKTGKPLGLNNDPKNVFSIIEENEKPLLYITGEVFGGLTTKEEYSNYHFKAEFKWGEKKWEPRLNMKRDNGILYHCNGEHGSFWNVWMSSLEFQVQEGDCGDFIALNNVYGDVPADKIMHKNGKFHYQFNPEGELRTLNWNRYKIGQVKKRGLYEKPNGQWNTLEVICLGRTSIHVVNGKVVNVVKNAKYDVGEKTIPISKGKIQIQSEAAEIYYRNIKIKPINKIPGKYQRQAKL